MEVPDIEVRTYGSGSHSVALLHGGPGAPGYMAPLARGLAADFHILEPLQRRAGEVPLTVAQHVADMAAVLPERVTLVGSSWGAMLALSFAAVHPQRVRGIVLVGCGTYDPASRDAYHREMERRLGADGRAQRDELRARLDGATDPRERERLFAALGDLSTAAQCYDTDTSDWEVIETDARGHAETWSDVLRLQSEGIEPAAFSAISAPALMLHGSEDPHPGPSTHTTLARYVLQLEYVELERCGHTPWFERHARGPFLALLRSWLGRLP